MDCPRGVCQRRLRDGPRLASDVSVEVHKVIVRSPYVNRNRINFENKLSEVPWTSSANTQPWTPPLCLAELQTQG